MACVAAGLVGLCGVAHAVPTAAVVRGYEPMSVDNRRVLVQEWLAEAFTMWGVAVLVVVVTVVDGDGDAARWVYRVAAALLVALAALTAATGARTAVVWFKICPALLAVSAALLVVSSWM